MKKTIGLLIIQCVFLLLVMTSCSEGNSIEEDIEETNNTEIAQEETSDTTDMRPTEGVVYTEWYRLDDNKQYIQEIDNVTMEIVDVDGNVHLKVINDSEETFIFENEFQILRLEGDEYVDTYMPGFSNSKDGCITVRDINVEGSEIFLEEKIESFEINPGDTYLITLEARNYCIDQEGVYKFTCSGFEMEINIILDWVC